MRPDDLPGSTNTGLNRVLAQVFRWGLLASVGILVLGVVVLAAKSGVSSVGKTSITGIPGALRRLEAGGFFSLGLLVLILTPVAGILALLVFYVRDKRWLFAGMSLFVLLVLGLSGFLGLQGG
jgi:uncharacterized membrane protein